MGHILVIDDDVTLLTQLVTSLEEAGHTVDRIGDVDHARHLFRKKRPNLVILEVRTDHDQGWDLLGEFSTETPVIVVSAHSREEDVIRGLDAGAVDYLGKPYRSGELLARVRSRITQQRLAALAVPAAETLPLVSMANHGDPLTPVVSHEGAKAKRISSRAETESSVFMSEAEELALLRMGEPSSAGAATRRIEDEDADHLSIGKRLHRERMRRQMTLVEAENKTKVRLAYLQAMEDDKFTLIPRGPAALSMVRAYSEFLGLDVNAVMEEFRRHHYSDSAAPLPSLGGNPLPRSLPANVIVLIAVILALGIGIGSIALFDPTWFARTGQSLSEFFAWLLSQLPSTA